MTWPMVALGEVTELIRGITYKPSDICNADTFGAVACMRTKNVQTVLDESDIVWIPSSLVKNSSKYLQPSDLLVSSANSWNLVGKACWVPQLQYPATAGGFISILRANEDRIDARYLYYLFTSEKTQRKLRSYSNSTTNISNLDHKRTLATLIPLPPLEEQRRIAAILDKVESIAQLSSRREALIKEAPKSIYIEMFGDPKRNDKGLPVFPLKSICTNEDSKRIPVKSTDRKERQGQYPYYGASGIIDFVDSFIFQGERLLVAEDGANLVSRSLPVAFVASGKFWVNNHAHVLAANGAASLRFLETFFACIDLSPYITGSAQPKLTRAALDSLLVPLPPLDEQIAFEKRVLDLIGLHDKDRVSKQNLQKIQASLQKSFLG